MSKEIGKSEEELFNDIRLLVEETKSAVRRTINSGLTIMYWNIGRRINTEILKDDRAEYGQQIVKTLSNRLKNHFGKNFELRNLRRMMQFAEVFPDFEMVSTLSTQLIWSHFVELFPIKEEAKRDFYAQKIAVEQWSV